MINPSNMRVVDVARLLNSTSFGFVLAQARLYREFNRVGFRIGSSENPRNINLLKYIAWMFDRKHTPEETSGARSYEDRRNAERDRQAEQSLAGRDIGPLPEVVNPDRKAACERNFQLFCESYFPETYALAWSPDHLKVIEKIETAVLRGGLFALALPRGSGKTTITESAALWSMLYGHREFVVLIGATESAALELLDSLNTELEVNERLAEDFPEVCYPVAQLKGIANRCAGQLYKGERTRITWTSNEIVLPTVEGSRASGIIVRVAGITGRIRGMKFKRSDGRSVRPSLVIIDDPQTSESAGSLEQTRKRVRVLAGDILGLAGPGQKISGIMPCTIIRTLMPARPSAQSRRPETPGFPAMSRPTMDTMASPSATQMLSGRTAAEMSDKSASRQAETAAAGAMNEMLPSPVAMWSKGISCVSSTERILRQ